MLDAGEQDLDEMELARDEPGRECDELARECDEKTLSCGLRLRSGCAQGVGAMSFECGGAGFDSEVRSTT